MMPVAMYKTRCGLRSSCTFPASMRWNMCHRHVFAHGSYYRHLRSLRPAFAILASVMSLQRLRPLPPVPARDSNGGMAVSASAKKKTQETNLISLKYMVNTPQFRSATQMCLKHRCGQVRFRDLSRVGLAFVSPLDGTW